MVGSFLKPPGGKLKETVSSGRDFFATKGIGDGVVTLLVVTTHCSRAFDNELLLSFASPSDVIGSTDSSGSTLLDGLFLFITFAGDFFATRLAGTSFFVSFIFFTSSAFRCLSSSSILSRSLFLSFISCASSFLLNADLPDIFKTVTFESLFLFEVTVKPSLAALPRLFVFSLFEGRSALLSSCFFDLEDFVSFTGESGLGVVLSGVGFG